MNERPNGPAERRAARRALCLCTLLGGVLGGERLAQATTELNAQYDARAAGMGGVGVAFISNGASLYLNPATLDGIKELAVTANLTAVNYELRGPFAPNDTVSSGFSLAPYFLVGGGYRVAERIVVGAAVFPTVGVGTKFERVAALGGNDVEARVASIEAALGASYAITDRLALGLTYRVTHTNSETALVAPVENGLATVRQDLGGTSFLGLSAGLLYRPIDRLSLGFTSRSKTTATLDGTQQVAGLPEQKIEQEFSTPHSFRVGSALRLLDDRLLLALDAKALLYKDSNRELVTELVDPPPGTPPAAARAVTTQAWKNVFAGSLGAEFALSAALLVRGGVALTTSATPKEHALPFIAPPKPIPTYHLGAGLRLDRWELDLGAFLSVNSTNLSNAQYPADPTPTPGRYEFTIIATALSLTYRL